LKYTLFKRIGSGKTSKAVRLIPAPSAEEKESLVKSEIVKRDPEDKHCR
jgi:hypothetical protein